MSHPPTPKRNWYRYKGRRFPRQSTAEVRAGFQRADRIDKELDRQFKLAVERPNT